MVFVIGLIVTFFSKEKKENELPDSNSLLGK
jgi:hypothetical protein